jgi:predicted nucleic acid-binding protein
VPDVLVDTSAWVAFLRGEKSAVKRLDPLIADDRVAIAGAIYAEVLAGAPTLAAYQQLRVTLDALAWLDGPADIWERVAHGRFTLARQGVQATIADLLIAVTASHAGQALLTRDRDFLAIAQVVPLDVLLF